MMARIALTARRTMAATLALSLSIGVLFALSPAGASATEGDIPIEHVVVIMQEDRTFDNYFGTYPGANGWPDGYALRRDPEDDASPLVTPHKLVQTRTPSLPHSDKAMVAAVNGGRMDAFVSAAEEFGASDGALALGYYDGTEIPYYWHLADEYVLADNWFSSVMGPSFPNHLFLFSASRRSPDGIQYDNVPEGGMDLETIFDRLEDAGVSWKVYIQGYDPETNYRNTAARLGLTDKAGQLIWVPLVGIPRFVDDPVLSSKLVPIEQYYVDAANGELPEVAYITPSGLSEHPPGDLTLGHFFVMDLLESLMMGPNWDSSAFIVTWDEWGGWGDHAPPPQVDEDGYGVRVPALIVSPYAKRGFVDQTLYDHTSVLAFIETLHGIEPLTARDAAANDLLNAFDFDQEPREPRLPPPEYPEVVEAGEEVETETVRGWYTLLTLALVSVFVALGLSALWARRR
jgi:phospholipase C